MAGRAAGMAAARGASGRGGQFDPEVVDAFIAVLTARHPEMADEIK